MAQSPKTGAEAAPDPNAVQTFSMSVDATGATYKLRVTQAGGGVQDTATIAPNANAATVKAALDALLKLGNVTVSGGVGAAGGGTPYVIGIQKGPVQLSVTANTLTGGAGTVSITHVSHGPNRAVNQTVLNPTNATATRTAPAKNRVDRKFSTSAG